jgi:corrinoid protein of di/trimethylamine methyltransferase
MLKRAREIEHQLSTWRREFHVHPELGFQETRTADRVNELLATYQPSPIADELRAELRDIVTKAKVRHGRTAAVATRLIRGGREMSNELLTQITTSIIEGEPDEAVDLTRQAIEADLEPLTIINEGLVPGMNIVGAKFQSGEYFLPHLIIAASGMQRAMELLEPELQARQEVVERAGTLVIGSVAGDIHEIGKTLVGTMMSASGFQVYDLGVNVPTETFVAKVKESGANLLGLSALLTTTMTVQREVIEALEEAGIRDQVKVIIGGAPVSQKWADTIGADGYAEDAVGAMSIPFIYRGRSNSKESLAPLATEQVARVASRAESGV